MKVTVIPAAERLDKGAARGDWFKLTHFEQHFIRGALLSTLEHYPGLKENRAISDLLEKFGEAALTDEGAP